MKTIIEMNYLTVSDLVYAFVCNDQEPVDFQFEGNTWQVVGFGDGAFGHHVTIARQDGDWYHYNEYYYSRERKMLVGMRKSSFFEG